MDFWNSTPLKILVAADLPPDPNSGAAGTVYQMNAALRRLGHEVTEIWAQDLGRRIRHGNLHCLLELPFAYRRVLKKQLSSKQFDVLEFNQPHAYLAARAFRSFKLNNSVFVNRSHGHEVRIRQVLDRLEAPRNVIGGQIRLLGSAVLRRMLERQWKLVASSADGFHVSCRDDCEFLQSEYDVDEGRIGTITQGIPQNFATKPVTDMSRRRLRKLLYIGQFSRFKAPLVLAGGIASILASRPDVEMTWICGRSQHQDVSNILAPVIRSRVSLRDWMPQEQLANELDQHGIFLFPSYCEGFGKAPLEAMSRGLAVVASNTGGMRDFIQHDKNGRLVPVGDAAALATSVIDLLDHPDHAIRLGNVARATALQHTWNRCATDLVAFYRSLLNQKSSKQT